MPVLADGFDNGGKAQGGGVRTMFALLSAATLFRQFVFCFPTSASTQVLASERLSVSLSDCPLLLSPQPASECKLIKRKQVTQFAIGLT